MLFMVASPFTKQIISGTNPDRSLDHRLGQALRFTRSVGPRRAGIAVGGDPRRCDVTFACAASDAGSSLTCCQPNSIAVRPGGGIEAASHTRGTDCRNAFKVRN